MSKNAFELAAEITIAAVSNEKGFDISRPDVTAAFYEEICKKIIELAKGD